MGSSLFPRWGVSPSVKPMQEDQLWQHLSTNQCNHFRLVKCHLFLLVCSTLILFWTTVVSNIFYFSPRKIGENSHFDEHIFQMGWFNHQLAIYIIYIYLYLPWCSMGWSSFFFKHPFTLELPPNSGWKSGQITWICCFFLWSFYHTSYLPTVSGCQKWFTQDQQVNWVLGCVFFGYFFTDSIAWDEHCHKANHH